MIDITLLSRLNNYRFLLSIVCLLLYNGTQAYAQGNLLITPNRIVFDGPQKMQELNLANTGKDTATYLVSFMEIRMKEDGSFEPVKTPDSGQQFASKYLRYFPRSITLAPNEAQSVKVQLSRTAQLTAGEYRSHLYFRAETPGQPLGTPAVKADSPGISVTLTPIFGITIPVIIRVGSSDTRVSLADPSLSWSKEGTPVLNITFQRAGNMSVYGDVTVEHVSPQGNATIASFIKGVAVYTPTQRRQLKIALATDKKINYHSGRLRISYQEHTETQKAKPIELATVSTELH